MDNCTFPRYKDNDIVMHIRNCLLTGNEAKNLTKSDLFPNIKAEVLHMIYMRTLQKVYGIRPEHLHMMPPMFQTDYPQIFEGFLPIGNLYMNLERLFPICRVRDFQIADIISPDAKRTARFLSGILNFLLFCDERCGIYLEIQSIHKSAMEKFQRLEMANQEAALKLEKLNAIPADQQQEFSDLSRDIKELEQKLNQEYRQKASSLQEAILQKKMELAEKTQSLNELKLVVCNLKEEGEELKSKITESPEELTNCNERLKETIKKLKMDKQRAIEKYEVYRDLVEVLPSCQLELQLYQKKMQIQATNMERMSGILAEIRILEDQIENSKSRINNAKTEEMSLKRLVMTKREKIGSAEIKIKKMHQDVEQRRQAITEYCNKIQEKRGTVCKKLMTAHAEIKQLKGAIQQLNDSVDREKLKAQEIYLSLRVGLEKYHENLAQVVESYMSARQEKIAELEKLF